MRKVRPLALALLVVTAVAAGWRHGHRPRAAAGHATDLPGLLLQILGRLSPDQALQMRHGWGIPGWAVACAGAPGGAPDEVPVLGCHWGRGFNVMYDGRALFWQEGGRWRTQPFPVAIGQRKLHFRRLIQVGRELVAIMDTARAETYISEEVYLLRRTGDGWRLLWSPGEAEWSRGHTVVGFRGPGIGRFTVLTDSWTREQFERYRVAESNAGYHREFREEWVRTGDRSVRVARRELPTPYGAVVHFVAAVARGEAAEAVRWAAGPGLVQQATELGIPRWFDRGYLDLRSVPPLQAESPGRPLSAHIWSTPRWTQSSRAGPVTGGRADLAGEGWVVLRFDQPVSARWLVDNVVVEGPGARLQTHEALLGVAAVHIAAGRPGEQVRMGVPALGFDLAVRRGNP